MAGMPGGIVVPGGGGGGPSPDHILWPDGGYILLEDLSGHLIQEESTTSEDSTGSPTGAPGPSFSSWNPRTGIITIAT